MNVTTLNDKLSDLHELREKGVQGGYFVGFDQLSELMSFKKGFPIYIGGMPHAGKTEILLEWLVTTSELYGWKHFMYLGETGEERDIFAELCYKYIKKPYRLKKANGSLDNFAMTEIEARQAESWVNEHFYLMPPEEDFTYQKFYHNIEAIEMNLDIKFDTTCIDPVIDLEGLENKPEFLNKFLKTVQQECKKHQRIDILAFHVGKPTKEKDKNTGLWYNLPHDPDQWAGGLTPHRKGFQMILVYRTPMIPNEEGNLPPSNEVQLIIQKSKPKGVGKLGLSKLYWEWETSRYYEIDHNGNKRYSRKQSDFKPEFLEQHQMKIQPSKDFEPNKFIEPNIKEDNDDLPF